MKNFYETHNGKTISLEHVVSIEPIKDYRNSVKRYVVHLDSGQSVDDYAFQFVAGDYEEQVNNWKLLKKSMSNSE